MKKILIYSVLCLIAALPVSAQKFYKRCHQHHQCLPMATGRVALHKHADGYAEPESQQ